MRLHVGVWIGKQPLHAVRSDAAMAVADALAELRDIGRNVQAIDNQEIIAAGIRLDERNDSIAMASFRLHRPQRDNTLEHGRLLQCLQHLLLLLARSFQIKLKADMLPGLGHMHVFHHGVDAFQARR